VLSVQSQGPSVDAVVARAQQLSDLLQHGTFDHSSIEPVVPGTPGPKKSQVPVLPLGFGGGRETASELSLRAAADG
jgi:hypothetical protein